MRTLGIALLLALAVGGCRNEACEGSVVLSSEEDVEAVLDCTHLTMLGVQNSALVSVDLPNLKTIERDLGITDNARLTSVSFPSLETVGGAVRISRNTLLSSVELAASGLGGLEVHENLELETLDVPSLARLSPGGLDVMKLASLETLSLPKLEHLDTGLSLQDNDRLAHVALPALANVGGGEEGGLIQIARNDRLNRLELPALAKSERNVIVGDNARLVDLELPSLTTAPMLVVESNRTLARLAAPALTSVTVELEVNSNPALVELDLDALSSAGCVYIHHNVSLPDCEVAAVLEGVTMTCGRQSTDNKGDGCL